MLQGAGFRLHLGVSRNKDHTNHALVFKLTHVPVLPVVCYEKIIFQLPLEDSTSPSTPDMIIELALQRRT